MPVISVLSEFTAGVEAAAACGGRWGLFLTGFAVGFSGFSVFAQSMTFTAPCGLRLRRAVLSKSIQGLLCGAAAAGVGYRLPTVAAVAVEWDLPHGTSVPWAAAEIVLLILFCLVPVFFQKRA